jgi:hypothetical protein
MNAEDVPENYRLVLYRFDGSIETRDLVNRARHVYAVGDEIAEEHEGKWRVTGVRTLDDGTPVLLCEQMY